MTVSKLEERISTALQPVGTSEGFPRHFSARHATNYMFTSFLTWVREGRHYPFILNAQDV